MPRDADLPARAQRLSALTSVLEGKQYNHLKHAFADEETDGGEYVPLGKRRPSARSNLCRVVVDDAVSLLFSEGHFPTILATDKGCAAALADLVKVRKLNALMIEAATKGSVGSVAVLLRVLNRKPFFFVMPTAFLTPAWAPDDPERLVAVTEKYKVAAADLAAQGYTVDPTAGAHWFQRQWTEDAETWFLPWLCSDPPEAGPTVDTARTVRHGLGFCPFVWIKNLPGGDEVDGDCTYEIAIDTVIEGDYLLSQSGRALKYASDPTLVLKDAAAGSGAAPQRTGGASRMMQMAPESDAKLLEINGTAATAVGEHIKTLRSLVLEQLHGNRTDADRLSAASSGRAMELMNQSLVWLADRMRITYADGALLALLRLVCRASAAITDGLQIGCDDDNLTTYQNLNPAGLSLRWPAWYAPTHVDKQAVTTALTEAKAGGIMSRETAIAILAPVYDVPDVDKELSAVLADEVAADARAAKNAAATTIMRSEPD